MDTTKPRRRGHKIALVMTAILFMLGMFIGAFYLGTTFSFIMIFVIIGVFTAIGLCLNMMHLRRLVREAEAYNQYLADNHIDAAAEEEAFKAYINQTTDNVEADSFRAMALWLRTKPFHPKKHLDPLSIFNLGLLIVFLTCLIAFVVFIIMDMVYIALACFVVAFADIGIILIIHAVHKHIANNPRNINQSLAPQQGTVTACTISDETSVTTGRTQTTRILSTTYLVDLDVNGEPKKAYTKQPYNPGTTVYVRQNTKLTNMVVIDE